jgi:hypothetical protein
LANSSRQNNQEHNVDSNDDRNEEVIDAAIGNNLNADVTDDDAFMQQVHGDAGTSYDTTTTNTGCKSTKSYLSQSFHGSRRHLRGLARNALAIVSEKDSPSLFITLTYNPHWAELLQMLPEGQCAYDRPDITNRVFKNRLQCFMHNLRAGKYFDDFYSNGEVKIRRKVLYEIQVIEYQNRGLPHCHLVVKLENTPSFKDDLNMCADWVDSHIQAEILKNPITKEDHKILELQQKHMTHTCRRGQSGCLNEKDKCSKHFDTHTTLQHSTFHEKTGRVNYRRRSNEDLNICPHERRSLLD